MADRAEMLAHGLEAMRALSAVLARRSVTCRLAASPDFAVRKPIRPVRPWHMAGGMGKRDAWGPWPTASHRAAPTALRGLTHCLANGSRPARSRDRPPERVKHCWVIDAGPTNAWPAPNSAARRAVGLARPGGPPGPRRERLAGGRGLAACRAASPGRPPRQPPAVAAATGQEFAASKASSSPRKSPPLLWYSCHHSPRVLVSCSPSTCTRAANPKSSICS